MRFRKWGMRALCCGGLLAGGGVALDVATDRSLTRSCRALYAFGRIASMYKFTTPETPEAYFTLHRTAAQMILDVCLTNEGLYVKLGQGMNAMSHILPKEYTDALKVLLDDAKPVAIGDIERIIREETGKDVSELFDQFDPVPIASASIAQVHRARLKSSDQDVAVKVRKPCVGTQSVWDIYTFQFISYVVEKVFKLPTGWSRQTIVDGLRREMDFTIEAANAEQIRKNFSSSSSSSSSDKSSRIYIPRIYHELSSPRLLVLEWVDATKLIDVERIHAQYDAKAVLTVLFDAFGDMVFKHGFVHCDPHAANVMVRPMPGVQGTGKHNFQVVLIDFGLCVPETEQFRMQYALLFKSLVSHDMRTLRRVVMDWGIADPEIFASIQMQKPLSAMHGGSYGEVTREEVREMQRSAHSRAQSLLMDEARIPRELPLVGRGIDILRGINRLYGSPISRINMLVRSAVEALGPLHDYDGVQRYVERVRVLAEKQQEGHHATVVPSSSSSGGGKQRLWSSGGAAVREPLRSAFDESSEKLRREQAAAVRELEAGKTTGERVLGSVSGFYRAVVFRLVMLQISILHHVVRWYNTTLLCVLLPQIRAKTLDDRVDAMETSLRVE